MQIKNLFFSEENYKDKLKSVTNLRIITFLIWKFLIGIIIFWLFIKLIQNDYFNFYILNEVKIHFKFSDFIKIFFLFAIIDYLKILLFQNSEDYINNIELITKIFLEPKYQTLFLFANSVLILLQLKIFYYMTKPGKKQKTDMLDTLIIVYGICNSMRFLICKKNLEWNQLNRISSLKFYFKKFFSKLLEISLTNILIFTAIFILYSWEFNLKDIFYSKTLRLLLVSSLFIEFSNYISFQIIRNMITTPINPHNSEIKSDLDLIRLKFDFEKNNKFENIHYLQNLIYMLKDIESDPKLVSFDSKENVIELKYKIENIFNEFNFKLKDFCIEEAKDSIPFAKKFTDIFIFSDLFYKNTSFKILESFVEIITVVVKIFVKMHKNCIIESQQDTSSSPKKNLGDNQKYLINFFDLLLSLEDNFNKLIKNENFSSKCAKYKKYEEDFLKLKNNLSLRIKHLIKKNFKENFLIFYSENTRNRIGQYISSTK